MRKIFIFFLFILSAFSYAQTKETVDPSKVESYEDSKAGVSFKYKPFYWRLFLDKKTIDGTLIKDFAIIKRISSFNQVRIHMIQLKTAEDFDLNMNKYRDAIFKERINVKNKSRGVVNRPLTDKEIQEFGCEKGKLLGYTYADKFKEVNAISLYFMLKGSKIYVLETYLEKRTEKEDKTLLQEVVDTFKILN